MEVTLSELIVQVREELLTPSQGTQATYPFLFVDEVELELGITVSKKADGSGKVNIAVLEIGGGVGKTDQQTHRIKVKMTPLLTKEEIREKLKQNKQLWEKIESVATQATTKDAGMLGKE